VARKENLLVSWRRDAELAMEMCADTKARSAYDAGDYAAAYRLANEAYCLKFPVTFVVKKFGKLGPFPLRVTADRNLHLVLKEYSNDRIRFAVSASGTAEVKLEMESARADELWQ